MAKPKLRLDAHAVFWRAAIVTFCLRQLWVWYRIQNFIPASKPVLRLWVFFFGKKAMPMSLLVALMVGGLVVLLADFWLQFLIRPLVKRWLSPPSDPSSAVFHLSPNEWIIDSAPARRFTGWLWRSGTLVRTNHRLWFFPNAWDAEPWSQSLGDLKQARLKPAPRAAWGFIRGWPERLALTAGADAEQVFAVADPEGIVSWFPTSAAHT